ncbi:MAG: HEAT repeat domain-containing protein, partial [SAR202 cluster bacterium]|nr:HEAT repeat domain-containing protein [SAR202 cluster bacterium]
MPGLNPLVETLALGDGSERRLAALTLGRLEDARAAGPLCHALADDDPAVRAAAMEALYRLGARALHALSRSLRTGPQRERYHTAALLGEIGGPEAAA